MSLPSRIDAERRYGKIRAVALEIAQASIDDQLKLTKITKEALDATRLWSESTFRKYDWDWRKNYSYYRMRYPKRFEVALWDRNTLVAISLGRPTYNAAGLRLDIVEAMPRDIGARPSVFDKIILAYEIYARMLNANHIRIMNPVNDKVKTLYENYGYTYVAKGDYLSKDVL
ncbi:MAG: hypothetical protein WED00_09870 [Aquisalimonadaceae bacterium]